MKNLFDGVNLIIILGLLGFSLWAWPELPDQIPTHFNASGVPDAWKPKSSGTWLLAPGVGLALVLGMGFFRLMLPKRPGWVNLPDKTKLTDLPEVARKPVVTMLSGFLSLVQLEILVIFALIQWSTYRAALGHSTQGTIILILVLAILASPFLLVVFFLRLQKALDEGKRLVGDSGEGDS
jgi:uncharacterized membrane protein